MNKLQIIKITLLIIILAEEIKRVKERNVTGQQSRWHLYLSNTDKNLKINPNQLAEAIHDTVLKVRD
ncbi:hypothetical protein EVU91_01440 [Macrococcoides bohemicum]|nr:hypothetical protein EVU91_01440 [Macrococcus bohemicus]